MASDEGKKLGGGVSDAKAPATSAAAQNISQRMHTIKLEDLILHRYSEHDALFKKADKVAREILDGELREGEGMRSLQLGVYQLYFPKLKPDAGSLRASVIAEQVARAVKELNPTANALERRRHEAPPPASERRVAKIPARGQSPSDPGQRDEEAIREAASRAFARMAEAGATQSEDFDISEGDKKALDALEIVFHPVWHAKNNLITAYNCTLTHKGKKLSPHDILEVLPSPSMDLAMAKLDASLYGRAAKAMQYLLSEGLKAVLIVPVHFSTVDRLRYIGGLLEAAGTMPDEAKQLMVFELTDLPTEMSRFRLREPVNYLRTRARALVARTGFVPTDFELYKEFNFHGVSVDLRDLDLPEARTLKSFNAFAALAEKNRMQSFVHGISSTSLVVGAMAAGFTYIEGSAISEPVRSPKQIRPYEIDMLYKD